MAAPSPAPSTIKLNVSYHSLVFPLLTTSLDLKKVTGVRVAHTATKNDLVRCLEIVLFGRGPREEHDLFKHGRQGQWGWDLWVAGPGMGGWRRLREGEAVGSFAGDGGAGPVRVKGVICYDPEYVDKK